MRNISHTPQPEKPEEMPIPAEHPEMPGKSIPDTPMIPPDKPETIPPEKPGTDEPAPEIPTQPSHKTYGINS